MSPGRFIVEITHVISIGLVIQLERQRMIILHPPPVALNLLLSAQSFQAASLISLHCTLNLSLVANAVPAGYITWGKQNERLDIGYFA